MPNDPEFPIDVEPDSAQPDDLLYEAWTVIANASDWFQGETRAEWISAACRWRDKWHAKLDVQKKT